MVVPKWLKCGGDQPDGEQHDATPRDISSTRPQLQINKNYNTMIINASAQSDDRMPEQASEDKPVSIIEINHRDKQANKHSNSR